jgi:hypothetical protein
MPRTSACLVWTRGFLAISGMALGACSSNVAPSGSDAESGNTDAGGVDAGVPDSGLPDSGLLDSGAADSGTPDSSAFDSGPSDAGNLNGWPADAGTGGIAIPAQAPYGQWTPFRTPGAICADGSPSIFAVNPLQGSTDLFLYLRAGDLCDSWENCVRVPQASFLSGYSPTDFSGDVRQLLTGAAFDRSDPNNPFRTFNFVFFTYCTGDLHSGNQVTTYAAPDGGQATAIRHVGYADIGIDLQRIVPTFSGVTRVVVAGSSAGGFGAVFNYVRVKAAFPGVPVYLVDDSGPYLPIPYYTKALEDLWKADWGFAANLPAGCPQCDPDAPDGGLSNLFAYEASDPSFRGCLISGLEDTTISNTLAKPPGDPNLPCSPVDAGCQFPQALIDLDQSFESEPGQMRAFFPQSTNHQWIQNARFTTTSVNGVSLEGFLTQELDGGGPGWVSQIQP